MGCLGPRNCIRRAVVWFVEWRLFDWFILNCIFGNSLTLAMVDYEDQDVVGSWNQTSHGKDLALLQQSVATVQRRKDAIQKFLNW